MIKIADTSFKTATWPDWLVAEEKLKVIYIISNLLDNSKVLFNNEENFFFFSEDSNLNSVSNEELSNINYSKLEHPKSVAKSNVISEDKKESNDIYCTKECSKEAIRD